ILAVLGWCLKVSTLAAQAPAEVKPGEAKSAPILPVSHSELQASVGVLGNDLGTASNRPWKLFNSHGMCCTGYFNQIGCGNLCSNLTFMFGSCRVFFGQECTPKPPHFGQGGNGTGVLGGCGSQGCCGR